MLYVGGAEYSRQKRSSPFSVALNCSLGNVERTEDSVGKALLLELISIKGRRCCVCLEAIVAVVLTVGFDDAI